MGKLAEYMYTFIPHQYLNDGYRLKPRGRNQDTDFREHVRIHGKSGDPLARIRDMFSLELYDHIASCFHHEIVQLGYESDSKEARNVLVSHEASLPHKQ